MAGQNPFCTILRSNNASYAHSGAVDQSTVKAITPTKSCVWNIK